MSPKTNRKNAPCGLQVETLAHPREKKIYFVLTSETLNDAPFSGSGELIHGHSHAMYQRSPNTALMFSIGPLLYM